MALRERMLVIRIRVFLGSALSRRWCSNPYKAIRCRKLRLATFLAARIGSLLYLCFSPPPAPTNQLLRFSFNQDLWPMLLGNVLEWYEFGVFGFLEHELTDNFFSASWVTWAFFALSFVLRPVRNVPLPTRFLSCLVAWVVLVFTHCHSLETLLRAPSLPPRTVQCGGHACRPASGTILDW